MARTPRRRGDKPIWVSIVFSAWSSVFLGLTAALPFAKPDWPAKELVTYGTFTFLAAAALLVVAGLLSPAAFKTIVDAFKPEGKA
jgi:hypothetical protein